MLILESNQVGLPKVGVTYSELAHNNVYAFGVLTTLSIRDEKGDVLRGPKGETGFLTVVPLHLRFGPEHALGWNLVCLDYTTKEVITIPLERIEPR